MMKIRSGGGSRRFRSASNLRVKKFLTNDKQLKQLREIKCVTVEELE